MRTERYITEETTEGMKTFMLYGHGLANTLAYMLSGFRNWNCYGLVRIAGPHNFGVDVDGVPMCAVYGLRESLEVESEETNKEQDQIDAGKTAIILFYGSDNSSHMRRMTPEEFDALVLYEHSYQKDDLFYNS